MLNNIILNTDSYKTSHFVQYPPGTQYISSYIESRGQQQLDILPPTDEIVHFGLQAFIKEYLLNPITMEDFYIAHDLYKKHGVPFYSEGWNYILNAHGGYLPLEIRALPEGTVVDKKVPQVEVVNTDPKCFWLTSYIETALLRAVWYPSTVATLSRETKKIIMDYLRLTCEKPDQEIGFKLHDFGCRGVSSNESAALGGMAHLVNFLGTDTVPALLAARKYYGEDIAGFSIPASEHSTMTAWGQGGESDAYANMLKQFGGEGKLVACVSDSYDIYNACSKLWGEELRQQVKDMGGTLVVRPDSGNPVEMVHSVVTMLGERFGFDRNLKGYKVLRPCIRVIQGDGVTPKTIRLILENLKQHGWSAENVAFGMGGALLQKVDRDTLKYAMKANAIKLEDGKWRDVYKDPVTDSGKTSKRGRVSVLRDIDGFHYYMATASLDECDEDRLVPTYRNGELLQDYSFGEVRLNASI